MMGWNSAQKKVPVQRKVFTHLSKLQQQIIAAIQEAKEIQVDLLSVKSGLPISKLNVELFNLELEGVVRGLPGNKYKVI
jgi:DNA processing protein